MIECGAPLLPHISSILLPAAKYATSYLLLLFCNYQCAIPCTFVKTSAISSSLVLPPAYICYLLLTCGTRLFTSAISSSPFLSSPHFCFLMTSTPILSTTYLRFTAAATRSLPLIPSSILCLLLLFPAHF